MNSYELKLYPVDEKEFIGTIDIKENSKKLVAVETVIILDRSGSMGDAARRVSNEVLPLFLSKLSYDSSHVVHLITFESNTQLNSVTGEHMKKLPISAGGGTVMAPAVDQCRWMFESLDSKKPVRVLTISDGEVNDSVETEEAATEFMEYLKTQSFTINSQAVRLFTSSNQPDTSALCSLLQINNSTTSQLADIPESDSNDSMASKMADLFKSDNFQASKSFTSNLEAIFKFPWQSAPTSQLTLVPGENLFWFKGSPPSDIKIGEVPVKIEMQAPLTLLKFQALIESKLFYIVDHMKILKVVGTEEATKTIKKIVEYFQQKETTLTSKSSIVKYLNVKSVHNKKISRLLSTIAKDESVKDLNSAQKAEYLREVESTNESPSWIERASRLGFDIDDVSCQGFILVFLVLLLIFIHKMFSCADNSHCCQPC